MESAHMDDELPEKVLMAGSQAASTVISNANSFLQTLLMTAPAANIEALPRDKQLQLFAAEAAVDFLTLCIPGQVHPMELLSHVCSYTAHQYSGLAQVSQATLKQIMACRPNFRLPISIAFCRFALALPTQNMALCLKTAEFAVELHRIWYHEHTHATTEHIIGRSFEAKPESENFNFEQIEALAIIFLCSPNEKVRTQGLELLQTAKVTAEAHPDCVHQDMYSVVLEHGPQIIKESIDMPFEVVWDHSSKATLTPHLAEIIGNVTISTTQMLQWSGIIGGLLKKGSSLAHETVKCVWKALQSKVVPAQQAYEAAKPTDARFQERLMLWSNYLAAAMGSCAVHDANIFEAPSTDAATLTSARELLRTILPLIRHDNELTRKVAENALSFLPALVVPTLVAECAIYEKQAFEDKSSRAKKNNHAPLVLSYAYRILSKNKHDGYLFDDSSALKHQLTYVCNQVDRIPVLATTTDLHDVCFWRYNLCLTIANLTAEIVKVQGRRCRDHIAPSTFQKLFAFVVQCSGYPDSMKSGCELYTSVRKAADSLLSSSVAAAKPALVERLGREKQAMQAAAMHAMVQLFFGPCDICEEEQQRKLYWASSVFADSGNGSARNLMKRLAQDAVVNLLRSNTDKKGALFNLLVDYCYACPTGMSASSWYFMTIVRIFLSGKLPLKPEVLLLLGLHKLGSADKMVAQNSMLLLQDLCRQQFPGKYPFVYYSNSFQSRAVSQQAVATQIAANYADQLTQPMVEEGLHRYLAVDDVERGRILVILEPFLSNIRLQSSKITADTTIALLERLAVLTMVGSTGRHLAETDNLWLALTTNKHNVIMVLNFLISLAVNTRSTAAIGVGCSVALLMARKMPKETCEKLVSELCNVEKEGERISEEDHSLQFMKEVESLATMPKGWALDMRQLFHSVHKNRPLSRCNVALMLLQEVVLIAYDSLVPHLPLVVLQAVLGLDSSNEEIQESAKAVLANLLFKAMDTAAYEENLGFIRTLAEPRLFGHSSFWTKGDHICRTGDVSTSAGDDPVRVFVSTYTGLLGVEGLGRELAMLAVRRASTCRDEHYKCRMLQLFRILGHPLQADVMHYLVAVIKEHYEHRNPAESTRSVLFETLLALQAAAQATWAQGEGVDEVPQLWWTVIACLHSDNKKEFVIAADLLAVILQNIDFDNSEVQALFASSPPGYWEVPFAGVQPLLLKGLTAEETTAVPRTLLTEFITLPWGAVIDSSPHRLLDNALAILPWMVHATNNDEESAAAIHMASNLQKAFADRAPAVAAVLQQFAQGEFMGARDFLDQFAPPFYEALVKGSELRAFTFLLGIVRFGPPDMRSSCLEVCRALFFVTDASSPAMKLKSSAMIYEYAKLVQTDNWKDAIDVLDAIVQSSAKAGLEKFEFIMFPNPSIVNKIVDRMETAHDPWTDADRKKSTILTILSDVLTRTGDPSTFQAYDTVQDREYLEQFPKLVPGEVHCQGAHGDVLHIEELLVFKEDAAKEGGAPAPLEKESSVVVNALLDSENSIRTPPPPTYAAPPPPIVVPPPSLITPVGSPLKAPLFSPRKR
mmetsp:Transcript_18198/g.70339  ORF Transcript_18198/g.70339 Transcript_18198/m.70339 type:complete len:1556 (+) Transcript_18198:630-5297(+)